MESKMKSIWKGSLSFGLVTIPVKLFSAIEARPRDINFNMVCATCHNPISYKRYCEHCKKELSFDEVEKGLRLADGSYFILTQEKLKSLRPEKTETIDIIEFVDPTLIDVLYYDAHYYMAPEKKNEKAYGLFLEALKKAEKVAVATFVMKDKEYICIINPYQNILLLSTIHYTYEIRPVQGVEAAVGKPSFTAKELTLALQLIKQGTKKKFDISHMQDIFVERVMKAVKEGKGTKKKVPATAPRPTKPRTAHDETLLTKLTSSLKKAPVHKRKTTTTNATYAKGRR